MTEENRKLNGANNENEEAVMTPTEKKQELLNILLEKAKAGKNKLTYSAIADVLDATDLDKNQMDDIYDALISKDIEINLVKGDQPVYYFLISVE